MLSRKRFPGSSNISHYICVSSLILISQFYEFHLIFSYYNNEICVAAFRILKDTRNRICGGFVENVTKLTSLTKKWVWSNFLDAFCAIYFRSYIYNRNVVPTRLLSCEIPAKKATILRVTQKPLQKILNLNDSLNIRRRYFLKIVVFIQNYEKL